MPTPGGSATVKDTNNIPAPQFWDTVAQSYGYLYGNTGRGEFYAAPAPITPVNSAGYVASLSVSGAHTFFGAFGQYTGTSAAWIMLFDSASAPSNGTSPKASTAVPGTSGSGDINWNIVSDRPWAIANGIYIVISSTGGTLTLVGSSYLFITVEYI